MNLRTEPIMQMAVATCLAVVCGIAIARPPFSFSESGKLASGRTYSLEILETPYVPAPGDNEDDGGRWGIDGRFPETSVTLFKLLVGEEEVQIPRKLYRDLSHLNRVRIREVKRTVQIEIRGGDAAGSFTALYTFRPREIRRVVRAGEMPDYVWEQTIWHNDFYDKSFDPEK